MTRTQLLSHILKTRNFGGFLAATWGCMLGGSLLLVGLTTLVGLLHESLYAATLVEALFGGLILGVYWHLAEQVYKSQNARGIKPAVLLFVRTLLISAFMPLTILLALYASWRESKSALLMHRSQSQKPQRTSLAAQIGRYYGRMAHIA